MTETPWIDNTSKMKTPPLEETHHNILALGDGFTAADLAEQSGIKTPRWFMAGSLVDRVEVVGQ